MCFDVSCILHIISFNIMLVLLILKLNMLYTVCWSPGVTAPTDKDITVRVAEADPVGFKLEFMPLEVGPHQLGVVYGCQCPTIEPLCVMAYDASCIKVMGVKDGLVGFLSRFIGTCLH